MGNCTTVVGLDVHKDSIVAAALPPDSGRPTETIRLENQPRAVERLARRLAGKGPAEFVYEAGPCGFEAQRQLTRLGQRCVVIAPGLIPVRPGDRVKTDRRDAEKLASLYRSGELTAIHIPSEEWEAARDLVRSREVALADWLRARHRLGKFLLRQGRVFGKTRTWGVKHREWLVSLKFEWPASQQTFEAYRRNYDEAEARLKALNEQLQELADQAPYRTPVRYLRCLKGVNTLSALTTVVETQEFRRFSKAAGFMSYTGLVSSEHSSGASTRRSSITKVGNAHLRRVLVEAAWCCRHGQGVSVDLARRPEGCPDEVVQIARKAQSRLCRKFVRLTSRGKLAPVAVVAVARELELAGFVWAIAQHFPGIA
jgi:transposase